MSINAISSLINIGKETSDVKNIYVNPNYIVSVEAKYHNISITKLVDGTVFYTDMPADEIAKQINSTSSKLNVIA